MKPKNRAWHLAIFTFLIAIALAKPATALDPNKSLWHYVHENWDVKSGLLQNSVITLIQTRDGYIWVGSYEALLRFDGVNFEVYSSANTDAMSNSEVSCFHEDGSGNLWIGTHGGGLLRYRNGEFRNWNTKDGLADDRVTAIAQDWNDEIVVAVAGGKLARLSAEGDFRSMELETQKQIRGINAILRDTEKNLWLGTTDGFIRLSKGAINHWSSEDGLPGGEIRDIEQDHLGDLWLATEGGVVKWRIGKGVERVFTKADGLAGINGSQILEDGDHNIWMGMETSGIAILKGDRFVSYTTDHGLSSNRTQTLMTDREGSLWVGGATGGLDRFTDGSIVNYEMRDGTPANSIWNVFGDEDNQIWVATSAGLAKLRDGRFEKVDLGEGGNSDVGGVFQDKNGAFWFGAEGVGLGRLYNGETTWFTEKNGFGSTRVRSVFEDSRGDLWIGTRYSGVYRYRNGTFELFGKDKGISDHRVMCIYETKAGEVWFATENGITIYDGEEFRVMRKEQGLFHNQISSIREDDDGRMWFTSFGGGLGCYENGKFYSVNAKGGILSDYVYVTVEDDLQRIWYSTNLGIAYIDKGQLLDFFYGHRDDFDSRAFEADDGMKNRECNGGTMPAVWKDEKGRLWFPTSGGASMVDPRNIRTNETVPPVYVSKVLVDGKAIDDGAKVEPGASRIEFHYAGLSYVAPDKVRFKYRLNGFDEGWIDAEGQRTAFYTNISHGKYSFEVKASNNSGLWNDDGTSFEFELKPLFYQTTWFFILFVTMFLGVGVLIFVLRSRQVKRRTDELSRLAWLRTKAALEGQVGSIRQMTDTIAQTSRKLIHISANMARTSTDMQSAVSKTGSAVEELEASGSQSGHNATGIVNASSKNIQIADKGRDAVDQSKIVMNNAALGSTQIDDKSSSLLTRLAEVDTMISMINSIADQSRVLAINASIESAMAGNFGAGFGVVAKEMGELAGQIKELNADMARLLTDSHHGVRDIVREAEQTREEMERGVKAVDYSRGVVGDLTEALRGNSDLANVIETAIEQQLVGLSLISKEINNVYVAATENTSISDEVEKEAQQLSQFVDELTEMIENWQTPEFYL